MIKKDANGNNIHLNFAPEGMYNDYVSMFDQSVVDFKTTTSFKNDSDKLDLALIPKVALEAAAKAFMIGERKYGRFNYCNKGLKLSQLVSAALRHLTAFNEGEENDPQDGQPHLGSVIACCAMILQQQKLGTLIDNRYADEEGQRLNDLLSRESK